MARFLVLHGVLTFCFPVLLKFLASLYFDGELRNPEGRGNIYYIFNVYGSIVNTPYFAQQVPAFFSYRQRNFESQDADKVMANNCYGHQIMDEGQKPKETKIPPAQPRIKLELVKDKLIQPSAPQPNSEFARLMNRFCDDLDNDIAMILNW